MRRAGSAIVATPSTTRCRDRWRRYRRRSCPTQSPLRPSSPSAFATSAGATSRQCGFLRGSAGNAARRAARSRIPAALMPADRCWWAGDDPLYVDYHDREWGFPVADDRRLFEKICLEGFQAGLSWRTILGKREAFRDAFANFDFERVARFDGARHRTARRNAAIVRHRGKIESARNNAQRARELAAEFGSLAAYFWRFEPARRAGPRRLTREVLARMPTSPESVALSQDLKRRGWTFVGPTTVYAFMQAMGLVNDHVHDCAIREPAEKARAAFTAAARALKRRQTRRRYSPVRVSISILSPVRDEQRHLHLEAGRELRGLHHLARRVALDRGLGVRRLRARPSSAARPRSPCLRRT